MTKIEFIIFTNKGISIKIRKNNQFRTNKAFL